LCSKPNDCSSSLESDSGECIGLLKKALVAKFASKLKRQAPAVFFGFFRFVCVFFLKTIGARRGPWLASVMFAPKATRQSRQTSPYFILVIISSL